MKIHPCQFQYPIQQSVHPTPSNRQKIPISLVRNEISLFTISSIVTTGERELSSCNIYRKFNHSSREPLPVEIPLLVLLIQQKFRGGQRFFPRYFCDVKKKKISREIVSRFIKIVYFFRTRGGCSSGCSALGFEYRHNILRQTRREREREIEREREREEDTEHGKNLVNSSDENKVFRVSDFVHFDTFLYTRM